MDLVTHGFSSFALTRAFFPRHGWSIAAGMIVAGTLADCDEVSALFGPAAYLRWHGTYTHSIPALLFIASLATFLALRLEKTRSLAILPTAAAMTLAATVHLLFDLCQSDGVALLWPVEHLRLAGDLLPGHDVWIFALLILGLALPELFRLVGSEIGAKNNRARGRGGALAALALISAYVGARFLMHANALAELDAHAYHGESPRRVGAFADTLSIFTWNGVVETHSTICLAEATVGPFAHFDPEAASCQHKPEPSAALEAAQQTTAAKIFLSATRFPKATVEATQDGLEVNIREMEDLAAQSARRSVSARIVLTPQSQVLSEELIWNKELEKR